MSEPQRPERARARGESRGSNIGDSGRDTWMDRHRWEVDVGTSSSPRPSDSAPKAKYLTIYSCLALSILYNGPPLPILVGANGILTQVHPKSRSVGLPSLRPTVTCRRVSSGEQGP